MVIYYLFLIRKTAAAAEEETGTTTKQVKGPSGPAFCFHSSQPDTTVFKITLPGDRPGHSPPYYGTKKRTH